MLVGSDRPMFGDPSGDLIDLADAGQILRRRWRVVALAMLRTRSVLKPVPCAMVLL